VNQKEPQLACETNSGKIYYIVECLHKIERAAVGFRGERSGTASPANWKGLNANPGETTSIICIELN